MNEEKETPIRCHICGSDFCITDQLLYTGDTCYDCLQESTLRAKWMMDGAETLGIAVQLVERNAKFLRKLIKDGWELQQPVKDDYAQIVRDPSRVKEAWFSKIKRMIIKHKPVVLKEIIISISIAIFGQFIFGILHEAGHALACEKLNLEYEVLLWDPWGVNHDPNFIVWLSGGMFAAIILTIILYIHRKNVPVAVGFLPLLIFQVISGIYEGVCHASYMSNLGRMPYVFLFLVFLILFPVYVRFARRIARRIFTVFYERFVRRSDDNEQANDDGSH